jgi:uncharacterized protein (UPF0332 family)
VTIEKIDDYILYRFHRAEESLDDALILANSGKWNTVVNRLYYSCFYAVIALLLKNGVETQSHNGARIQFGLHFIKTGKIEKKYGKLFTKLFDHRQKGDYGDLFDFNENIVEPLIVQVREFIEEIKKHIN